MRKISYMLSLVLLMSIATCKQADKMQVSGKISILVGAATLEKNGAINPIKVGDSVTPGSIIKTGKNSVVVIAFDAIALVEVQSESVFKVDQFTAQLQSLTLESGNLWLQVNKKLAKGEQFTFTTPTAVAAIRGTKLYSFRIGDMQGTCHCEGKVDYNCKAYKYHATHNKDYLTFTKGDKTILLLPEDLKKIGINEADHNHSQIDNSPLGAKAKTKSKKMEMKLMALIEKKFKEVK